MANPCMINFYIFVNSFFLFAIFLTILFVDFFIRWNKYILRIQPVQYGPQSHIMYTLSQIYFNVIYFHGELNFADFGIIREIKSPRKSGK